MYGTRLGLDLDPLDDAEEPAPPVDYPWIMVEQTVDALATELVEELRTEQDA
jgi:hypothetical protein